MESPGCRIRNTLPTRPPTLTSIWFEALGDLVDGEHFFDIVTDDVVYEVLYDFPGWPRIIHERTNLMAQFRGYCDNIELQSADKLITHKADNGRVVVIDEVDGTILATGVKYNNRFCSIMKIEDRENPHWRDSWILSRPGTR